MMDDRPIVEPSVTHFHGYTVESAESKDNGFQLNFEGGGVIESTGELKDDPTGYSLMTSVFDAEKITLKFGKRDGAGWEDGPDVVLGVGSEHKISDPRYDALPRVRLPETGTDVAQQEEGATTQADLGEETGARDADRPEELPVAPEEEQTTSEPDEG